MHRSNFSLNKQKMKKKDQFNKNVLNASSHNTSKATQGTFFEASKNVVPSTMTVESLSKEYVLPKTKLNEKELKRFFAFIDDKIIILQNEFIGIQRCKDSNKDFAEDWQAFGKKLKSLIKYIDLQIKACLRVIHPDKAIDRPDATALVQELTSQWKEKLAQIKELTDINQLVFISSGEVLDQKEENILLRQMNYLLEELLKGEQYILQQEEEFLAEVQKIKKTAEENFVRMEQEMQASSTIFLNELQEKLRTEFKEELSARLNKKREVKKESLADSDEDEQWYECNQVDIDEEETEQWYECESENAEEEILTEQQDTEVGATFNAARTSAYLGSSTTLFSNSNNSVSTKKDAEVLKTGLASSYRPFSLNDFANFWTLVDQRIKVLQQEFNFLFSLKDKISSKSFTIKLRGAIDHLNSVRSYINSKITKPIHSCFYPHKATGKPMELNTDIIFMVDQWKIRSDLLNQMTEMFIGEAKVKPKFIDQLKSHNKILEECNDLLKLIVYLYEKVIREEAFYDALIEETGESSVDDAYTARP